MSRVARIALLAALVLVLPALGHAATATVCPSGCNFMTITAALNGTLAGDKIVVFPGNYAEPRLTVSNRTLESSQPTNPSATTITNTSGQSVISASNATIEGFTITGGSAFGHGGGIAVGSGNVMLKHLTIHGNSAAQGGGVGGITGGATLTIDDCTIRNNAATRRGGGVEGVPGKTTILNSTIKDNSVTGGVGTGAGGGVYVPPSHSGHISNTPIISNTAGGTVGGSGGGVFSAGSLTISGGNVQGNMALPGSGGSSGGGIYTSRQGATIIGASVTGNSAGRGGGIFVASGSAKVDLSASVSGNTATNVPPAPTGSGIFCASPLTTLGGTISGNTPGPPEEIVGCGTSVDPPVGTTRTAEDNAQSGNSNDPVNTRTGELYQQFDPDIDLGGPMPLRFARYYNSGFLQIGIHANLGNNWRHNFDWRLTRLGTTIHIVDARGRTIQFTQNGAAWDLAGKLDVPYQLAENAGVHVLLDPRDDLTYTFDSVGLLAAISDGRGNLHALTYSAGPLTQVSDGLGRVLNFAHDTGGSLTSVDDGLGRSVVFGYTGSNLTGVTDLAGQTTGFSYSTAHPNLTNWGLLTMMARPAGNTPFEHRYWFADRRSSSELDATGNQTIFTYVSATDTTITDPLGNVRTHTHTATGELSGSQDQAGQSIALGSDATGRRNAIIDRLGDTTTMSYHAPSGKLQSTTHADGTTTSFSYAPRAVGANTVWDLTGITHADLSTESFAYDASGNRIGHTDQEGNTAMATHDGNGLPLTLTNRVGGVTSLGYNGDGTLASSTDPAGNPTTYGYDVHGRPIQITRTDMSALDLTYDDADRLRTVTDENANTTSLGYDLNGNRVSLTDPLLGSAGFAYDGNDRLLSVTEPGGGVSSQSYDVVGRVGTTTDPLGSVTTYGYDLHNRLSSVTDPLGNLSSQSYDLEGVLASHTDPLLHTTSFVSDRMGRITQSTSPLGHVTDIGYDAMGRVVSTTDPLGQTTTIGRDGRGRVSAITLPGGVVGAAYAHNALGLLTDLTDPNGGRWVRAYDSSGRVTGFTDPLLQTTGVAYDNRNRPSVVTLPGGLGTRTHSYDAVGNPTDVDYSDGTALGFSWDANDGLTSADSGGPDDVTRSYDANGRITNSNGIAVTRDPKGRITAMTLAPGKAVGFAYDANDRLTSVTDWDAGVTAFAYDAAGRLTGLTRPNGRITANTWDDDDRLIGITEIGVSSIALTRDGNGQITSAARNVPQPASAAGLGSRIDTFDAASQLVAAVHDPEGRVLLAGVDSYTWDLADRLTSYTVGGTTTTNGYDALGRRTSRTQGGVTRGYVWNDALALESISVETQGGADLRYYIHTPGGQLLYSMEATTNARRFHHYDEMGNTIFVTDDAGTVIGSYAYSPFGELSAVSGGLDNPFTWQGRHGVVDEGNGRYAVRARYYDSTTGRFLSRDPIRQTGPQSANPYQYALNNPLRYVDVNGKEFSDPPEIDQLKTRIESLRAERTELLFESFREEDDRERLRITISPFPVPLRKSRRQKDPELLLLLKDRELARANRELDELKVARAVQEAISTFLFRDRADAAIDDAEPDLKELARKLGIDLNEGLAPVPAPKSNREAVEDPTNPDKVDDATRSEGDEDGQVKIDSVIGELGEVVVVL